jgi:hypothetical protein
MAEGSPQAIAQAANRRILLRRRPARLLADGDTELVTGRVPQVAAGEALLQARLLAMDPVTRTIIDHDIGIVPSIRPGEAMRGFVSGIVVQSRNTAMPAGAKVAGFLEWADFQIVTSGGRTQVLAPDISLDAALNLYGHTAMAAYFGMLDIGKVMARETVVVSGAAGAVGSVAGQIARLQGASVVGIAGGPEKCRWLTQTLGFNAAIDYKHEDPDERLALLCEDGVDLFFDNVGGKLLQAVSKHMSKDGRVVRCGASAEYLAGMLARDQGSVAEVAVRRFNAMDYAPHFAGAAEEMLRWSDSGRLVFQQTILEGLEQAPRALNMLFDGSSMGRVLVSTGIGGR